LQGESTTNVIDLIGDDSQSVEYMIKCLYTSDYDHPEGVNRSTESALSVHTNVYALAGKYGVANLKTLAHQKYIDALSVEGLTKSFTEHLHLLLNEAPGGDRQLRDSALKFVGENYRDFAKDNEFLNLIRGDSIFAAEVLQAIASVPIVPFAKPCPSQVGPCSQSTKYVRTRSEHDISRPPGRPDRYECGLCCTIFD
jgi:hypothetical protein